MSKKAPKRYEIETIEQLVNVCNSENFDRLTLDFLLWLDFTNKQFESIRKKHTKLKNHTNSQIAKVTFVWIDDGKNGITKAELKNT